MKQLIRYLYKNIYNYYYGNIRSGRVRPFPSNIFIEVTNVCNLRCPICPSASAKRPKGFMDFALYQKIIDECVKYGKVDIMLHLLGEPLLHKELIKMIHYGKTQGNLKLAFSTNATLLTKGYAQDLIYSGLDGIHFSLDGFTRETYEKIRVGAHFEKTVHNIKEFLQLLRQSGRDKPVVEIQIIRTRETTKELSAFVKSWQKIAQGTQTIVSVKEYCTWAGTVSPQEPPKGIECRVPCPAIKYLLSIYWNGDVIPCCIAPEGYLKMGNAQTESLESIWQGDKMKEFRVKHSNERFQEIPFCDKCESTSRYINFKMMGDVLKRRICRLIGKRTEFLDIERK